MIVEGLIGSSSWDGCGGGGWEEVWDGGGWLEEGPTYPGGPLGGQIGPDTLEAHPHSRVHFPSHTLCRVVIHPACHA